MRDLYELLGMKVNRKLVSVPVRGMRDLYSDSSALLFPYPVSVPVRGMRDLYEIEGYVIKYLAIEFPSPSGE